MKEKEKVLTVTVLMRSEKVDIECKTKELKKLVEAADGQVLGEISQVRERPDAAYYIGKGKALELREIAENLQVSTIVFNNELSGSQIRNLEEAIDKKIVDRTNLILDIFASQAKTREGVLQVKLAQLKYRLPRLVGYRKYLSRIGGGIGTKGPGEQQLELDRRRLMREIHQIEESLKAIETTRETKRQNRLRSQVPVISLVGYTNAGKSTLMNQLINAFGNINPKTVLVEDRLFATLDTSHRVGFFANGMKFILADTVGFVSDLPTHLVESFKGTLEEIRYSDLILHVIDVSSANIDLQLETTQKILMDLKVDHIPVLHVFNKKDLLAGQPNLFQYHGLKDRIFISALDMVDIELLLHKMQEMIQSLYQLAKFRIPLQDSKAIQYIRHHYQPLEISFGQSDVEITVYLSQRDYEKYKKYLEGENSH